MEQITFEDMLTHYLLKLNECSDGLISISESLKKSTLIIESGWKGQAAVSCRIRLEEMIDEIKKSQDEVENAIKSLSLIDLTAESNDTTLV